MGTPLPLVRLSFLDLMRGFVAVGRRMSITRASQDLCLTQSAVSRQIHLLEEQLGMQLFVRRHRAIVFTPEGERLFRSADSALQQLQDVVGELQAPSTVYPVTLSASIGFTALWLLPRLGRFQQMHPGVDLRISANNQVADLRSEGIDLAVRYTTAAKVPADAQRLFGETVAPVAHPSLGFAPWQSPADLADAFLLEFDDLQHPWLQWHGWLHATGWPQAKPRGMLRFNQYDQAIQAALAGQGIALGRLELIQPLLDEGRLVRIAPPAHNPPAAHAYWLVHAQEPPREEVRQVAQWIQGECDRDAGAAPPAGGVPLSASERQ